MTAISGQTPDPIAAFAWEEVEKRIEDNPDHAYFAVDVRGKMWMWEPKNRIFINKERDHWAPFPDEPILLCMAYIHSSSQGWITAFLPQNSYTLQELAHIVYLFSLPIDEWRIETDNNWTRDDDKLVLTHKVG